MTKYKWWILGVLMLLFATAAAFLLRKRGALATGVPVAAPMRETEFKAVHFQSPAHPASPGIRPPAPAPADGASMLNVIKEELFSLERERISGEISATEYAEARAGLEAVLKRALKNG